MQLQLEDWARSHLEPWQLARVRSFIRLVAEFAVARRVLSGKCGVGCYRHACSSWTAKALALGFPVERLGRSPDDVRPINGLSL
jgi:hypothetical protein